MPAYRGRRADHGHRWRRGQPVDIGNDRMPVQLTILRIDGPHASNPPSSTRDHTIAPILPARDDAPTTATDLGWNNASRWRTVTSAPAVTKDDPIGMRHGQAIRRSTRTPSIGEAHAAAYMPNGRLFDPRQRSHHGPATPVRKPSPRAGRAHPLGANGAGVQRDAASASSKVRIYRSHGETLRELHGATRQHAKGDRNSQHACTTRMAQANAHALRNCAAVYRNSPRYPGESQRIRKTGSVNCAASQFNTPSGIAPEMHTNKTVRRPHGRSHRQSVRER